MSDVILFNPICDPLRINFTIPPWALLYVATPLVEEGYTVSIIDQNVEFWWKRRLRRELTDKTLFVGTTAMTGYPIKQALEFVKAAKSIRNVPVVWGGGHASVFPEQTLSHELVDYIVKGEGEETIRQFVRRLKQKKSMKGLKGLWYKEKNKIIRNPDSPFLDLNRYTNVPYHLVDVERYIYKTHYAKRNFEVCTSRGCPHRCAFCYNVGINRRCWRSMEVDRIIDHLSYVVNKFNLDGINWREDNFFVDRKRVEAICNAILKQGLDISWHSDSRIDYFERYDSRFIELLKKSGLSELTFGIESGSPRVLDTIKKDITVKQVLAVNRKMAKHNIRCMYHFSFGFVGEDDRDVQHTVRLAHRLLKENPNAGIWPPSIYTPYPGTTLFNESVKQGYHVPDKLEDFISLQWTQSNLPWLPEATAKKLKQISYIMGGSGSGIPLVDKWYKMRFSHLIRTGSTGLLVEKPFTDALMQTIRVARVLGNNGFFKPATK
jgi:anaerobic magnesium-protoporphyrin IX monomethyl ester cyclase